MLSAFIQYTSLSHQDGDVLTCKNWPTFKMDSFKFDTNEIDKVQIQEKETFEVQTQLKGLEKTFDAKCKQSLAVLKAQNQVI